LRGYSFQNSSNLSIFPFLIYMHFGSAGALGRRTPNPLFAGAPAALCTFGRAVAQPLPGNGADADGPGIRTPFCLPFSHFSYSEAERSFPDSSSESSR